MNDRSGERAAERARTAKARAGEASERLAELRDAREVGDSTYAQAADAGRVAVDRADLALRRAAQAHLRAADLHRRMARLMDTLGETRRAGEHRRLAEHEDAEASTVEAVPTYAR